MSKRPQRDLFSDTPKTRNTTPRTQGRMSETARHCPSTGFQAQKQRKNKSAKVPFERVPLSVEDLAAWHGVSVPHGSAIAPIHSQLSSRAQTDSRLETLVPF
ncbi:MAG: hypothetical protein JJ979_27260 [Roseibium sp.]|nr:hypothetical protein [Roseibium sp.]